MLISSFSRKCLNLLTVSRAITARWSSDHIKQFGQIRNSNLFPLVIWLPDIVSLWHISQFMISPQNGSDLLVFSLSKCSSPKICNSAISAAMLYIFACLLSPWVSVTFALNSAIVPKKQPQETVIPFSLFLKNVVKPNLLPIRPISK